jgi:excisionase family DNA binding protein
VSEGGLKHGEEVKRVPPKVEPEWLTVQELMALTGLGRSFCYELVATGQLEAIKAGRAVRISRSSYEAWIRRRRYVDVALDN